MKRTGNPISDTIMRDYKLTKKYQEMKKREMTIAQFQLKHCRYCKNKHTDLCEIRRDINNQLCCIYEEKMYEKSNIR